MGGGRVGFASGGFVAAGDGSSSGCREGDAVGSVGAGEGLLFSLVLSLMLGFIPGISLGFSDVEGDGALFALTF